MSKERARRRAQREAVAELERTRVARRARLRSLVGLARLRRRSPRPSSALGRQRPSSALGRQRARQNATLLAVLLPVHVVYWLLQPAWSWRLGALAATALVWPVLVVLLFDRRPSR